MVLSKREFVSGETAGTDTEAPRVTEGRIWWLCRVTGHRGLLTGTNIKYSMSGGFPLAPVEMLNMIKAKESHSKLFIEGDASNTWSQEVGMGQCHCWGSATPSLSKAEELWDQGSQIPSQHTGAAHPPLTALTQISPHPVVLISPLISSLTNGDS